MLTKLTIKNYRAIACLELPLGSKNLLMGLNGSGKTSVFDVLAGLRELVVEGERGEDLFPLSTVPGWLQGELPNVHQTFTLEVQGEHGPLTYTLDLEQDVSHGFSRVFDEMLADEGGPLFSFREGKVQLYRDNHSTGPVYTSDWNRSALLSVLPGPDNAKLTWFKRRLANIHCLWIDAPGMSARSERENAHPDRNFGNFASWYRRAYVSDTAAGAAFLAAIKEVIAGLDSLDLQELGQGLMVLEAKLKRPPADTPGLPPKSARTYRLAFSELSDGQRALIGLYALIHFLVREDCTLCIDEPDNFIALAEIQPWLHALLDLIDANSAQVLLSSHHPEMLNLLAPDHGIVLERRDSGPTTARKFTPESDSRLLPSEAMARGWLSA